VSISNTCHQPLLPLRKKFFTVTAQDANALLEHSPESVREDFSNTLHLVSARFSIANVQHERNAPILILTPVGQH